MADKADVAVVGVGSMGAMAAWQLARRGRKVVGFEQFAPGHDRGAHGGESRIFRTAYMEGEKYVPILQEAGRLWQQLEAETGRQVLTLNGGLMISRGDTEGLRNVRASIERFDLDSEILDAEQAARRWPQHRYLADDAVVLDRQAGFLRPELAVLTAARRAEELGAVIHRDRRVDAIEQTADGVAIYAGGERYLAETAVVAAGSWTKRLLGELPFRLVAQRLLLTWFAPRDPGLFSPERFPIFIREDGDVHFWGIPMIDGFSVKVSPHGSFGTVEDPTGLERGTTPEEVSWIRDAVRTYMPGLVPDPVRIGVYTDAWSPDGDFVVGRHPDMERVILLCGFSGHGFKMAPAIGRIAADLAIDGATELPIDHLAPSRFAAKRSSIP